MARPQFDTIPGVKSGLPADLGLPGTETAPSVLEPSSLLAESRDGIVRICHIITRLDRGGSSDNTLLTVLGLQGKGTRACVLKGPGEPGEPASPLERRARDEGIEIVFLPHLVRSIRPAMDVRAVTGIYRFLKARRFDIVHTHTSKAGFVGRVAARWAGAPVIIHTSHGHVFYGYFGPILTRLFLTLERWCARFTDRIITLTERGRREHLDLGVGLPEQYSVIPSGVPLENFFPDPGRGRRVRERLGIPPDAPVLGTVGRLTAVKDQRTLIAAAKILEDRHPDLVVLLIGDGGLKGKLEAQTRDLGLEGRIRFLGWQPDVPELLNALDVFVLCSLNEGMGRALVEAMASGLPVVTTNVGGMPDLVEEGVSGCLVPAGAPDALAAAVSRMLKDRGRLRSMGERSREKSAAYTVERMNNQLSDLYRDLVRERVA